MNEKVSQKSRACKVSGFYSRYNIKLPINKLKDLQIKRGNLYRQFMAIADITLKKAAVTGVGLKPISYINKSLKVSPLVRTH